MPIRINQTTNLPEGELAVRLNPGSGDPFVAVDLDTYSYMTIKTIADADRLIRAAVAAKDLLIEATGAQVRFPASLPPVLADLAVCPADHPSGAWGCTLPEGHDGPHKSVAADGTVRKEWDDEDPATAIAEDAVAIIAESIRTGQPVIVADDDGDPVATLIAAGYTLVDDKDSTEGGYVLDLLGPDGSLEEVGYGPTRDAALANLRAHLAAAPDAAAPLCSYCDVEPAATANGYCEACAAAVELATGTPDAPAAAEASRS